MSQPPFNYNFSHQAPQYYQQPRQQQPYQTQYQQQLYHHMTMQQQHPPSQPHPYFAQQPTVHQAYLPPRQTHWFDQMCEIINTQQSRQEAGTLETPPMLTPGNYTQWSSRFLRFLEHRKPHGKFLKKVIFEGPFEWPIVTVPATDTQEASTIPLPAAQLTEDQKHHYEADELAMILILHGIPNPIYRSVDAQKTAKAMWEHVQLLMEGTSLNKEDMESKLYMEYTNFMAQPGESLESYFHRFTNIVNDLERHAIPIARIGINSKFLGCLGPEWHKYVTFVRQSKNLHETPYTLLYDNLKHHEYEVEKDRALQGNFSAPATPNSLALVAQSYSAPPPLSNHAFQQEQNYFNYSAPPTSNQIIPSEYSQPSYDNTDPLNEDEDPDLRSLNEGLVLIANAFRKFTNKSNNRLRSSSNTRNQAIVQDGRVEIQNRGNGRSGSAGYMGNAGNSQRFGNSGGFRNGGTNPQKKLEIVETGSSNSESGKNVIICYNCNQRGHVATACPKPRTRGSAFHKQALLLALKDEAGGAFTEKDNSFMASAYSDDDMEDLEANAAVMLMANMQELHMHDSGPVYDTDGLSQVHNSNEHLIIDNAISTASASNKEQFVQQTSPLSSQENNQMNTSVTFDDANQINTYVSFDDSLDNDNGTLVEQNGTSSDLDPEFFTTINAKLIENKELTKNLKDTNARLTKDIECYKFQLKSYQAQEQREKRFETAFSQSYTKTIELEHQIRELTGSKNELISKLKDQTFEHEKQVAQLNEVISKTKEELATCQNDFKAHRKEANKKRDSYIQEIVDLERKIKEFENVVYKTGDSITTIQKLTVNSAPTGKGLAIRESYPNGLKKALNEIPKLYRADQLFDETVKRAVVYNCEEQNDDEDESRSKMEKVFFNKPFDYNQTTFVPSTENEKPWFLRKLPETPSNDGPVPSAERLNDFLSSNENLQPLPKNCQALMYFDKFKEFIGYLEDAVERNTEIKVSTFLSPYEKEKREIFIKQFLPNVQRLRYYVKLWEQELQKEVDSIIGAVQATERSISKHKRRNQFLEKETDRLMKYVLDADVLSVLMNSIYENGLSMCAESGKDEIELLVNQNETLREENMRIAQQSDDVKKNLSNEIFKLNKKVDFCQTERHALELKLHALKSETTSSNFSNESSDLQSQIDELLQERDNFIYNDRKLESIIQDKNHIIIELKEKLKALNKGKAVNTNVIAPGMYKVDKHTTKPISSNSNLVASTSSGLVASSSAKRSGRKRTKRITRIWKQKDGELENPQVEEQSRKKNKTHVTTALESSLSKNNSNVSVMNDEPMCAFNMNASCVFCRKSILSGNHTQCVVKYRLSPKQKQQSGIPSRPTKPSKSRLGKGKSVVSRSAIITPLVAKNDPKKNVVVTEFIKLKASTTWNWQRWIEKTHKFHWIPKCISVCDSNQTEPTSSLGSTLTVVPPLSPLCDAGGANSSLDC